MKRGAIVGWDGAKWNPSDAGFRSLNPPVGPGAVLELSLQVLAAAIFLPGIDYALGVAGKSMTF